MKTNFTEQDLQFYPTPKSLLNRITDSLKWNKITSVLEPSAGKGDIADYVKEKLNTPYTRYDIQIDCIEKDPALRKMLEGKEYHVIHDDFLTYHGQYHYDLIIFMILRKCLIISVELRKHHGILMTPCDMLKNQNR